MPIKFNCPKCGKKIGVPDNAAGKQGKCPGCGAVLVVPLATAALPIPPSRTLAQEDTNYGMPVSEEAPSTVGGGQSDGETITVVCPDCNKAGRVPAHLRGKRVTCKRCKGAVAVPTIDPGSPSAIRFLCGFCNRPGAVHRNAGAKELACAYCEHRLTVPSEQDQVAIAKLTPEDWIVQAVRTNWSRFKEWRERRRRQREAVLAQRAAQDARFRAANFQCSSCQDWNDNHAEACGTCGMPFRDQVALQAWRTNYLMEQQLRQARQIVEEQKSDRRARKGNTQGCGCLLMLVGALLCVTVLGAPIGGPMMVAGFIVLIVGLCL